MRQIIDRTIPMRVGSVALFTKFYKTPTWTYRSRIFSEMLEIFFSIWHKCCLDKKVQIPWITKIMCWVHSFWNKAAYLIGRVINDYQTTPFIAPILNTEQVAVYVDSLILDSADIDAVFGFSRAYFMVETQVSSTTVSRFLMNILPGKSKADLSATVKIDGSDGKCHSIGN